ncbi:MAG: hypothetical protein GY941_03250 [Planctomycetes bacterium]|nr:hypothetical protein [Planctomycetota bacterium]
MSQNFTFSQFVRTSLSRYSNFNIGYFFLLTISIFIYTSNICSAQDTLVWDPNTEGNLAGYNVHYGMSSRNYDSHEDVGNQTSYALTGFLDGSTYYFAVTAYDFSGNESAYSNEVIIISTVVNHSPVALVDVYSVEEEGTLTVDAPGVLVNDSDVDNDALTAILVANTSNGTLELKVDGSFTYNPISEFTGTDSFTYIASDGTADSNMTTVSITVNSASNTITISSVYFETGWDIWNDGGADASRSSSYANSGSYCISLRDNTSTSVMTTDNLNLSVYSAIEVQFSYYCVSMDNSNEDFWLQISTNGGSSFTTIKEWNLGDEFLNNERHNETVVISGISLSSTTKLRFRCDASGNSDWVYIDDVIISTVGNGGSGSFPTITQQPTSITVTEPNTATFSVSAYGNPVPSYQWRKNGTNINGATSNSYTLNPTSFTNDNDAQFDVVVSNSQGSVESQIATLTVLETSSAVNISSSDFETGWDIWNDGGSDASRSSSYANSGSYCIRLRDNTSTSVMTTDNLNLSVYSAIEVKFSYYCVSMDNSNEDFWLQISTNGGSSFTTIKEWNLGYEFLNNERHNETVVISGISLSSTTKLRFRCDASRNSDWVYIDDVQIGANE